MWGSGLAARGDASFSILSGQDNCVFLDLPHRPNGGYFDGRILTLAIAKCPDLSVSLGTDGNNSISMFYGGDSPDDVTVGVNFLRPEDQPQERFTGVSLGRGMKEKSIDMVTPRVRVAKGDLSHRIFGRWDVPDAEIAICPSGHGGLALLNKRQGRHRPKMSSDSQ